MRCAYCYNPELLSPEENSGGFPSVPGARSLKDFLTKRAGFLDGIVLSGGECTLNKRLPDICYMACSMGYSVKIDTNGTNPAVIKKMVHAGLVHYIALDYKSPPSLFSQITRSGIRSYELFSQSLDYLIGIQFPFEVRTTIHPDLLNESAVNQIIDDLVNRGYRGTYYLQHYFHTGHTIGNLARAVKGFDSSLLSRGVDIVERNKPRQ